MRSIRRTGMLVLLGWLWVSAAPAAEPVTVLASIRPLALLAQDVGGERVRVSELLAPGTSPHHFALRPSQRARLEAAALVFWGGPALERPLAAMLAARSRDGTAVALQPVDTGRESHAWLDPQQALAAARALADVLARQDPAGAAHYAQRYQALARAVQDEQARLQALLQPWQRTPLLLDHDFLDAFWPVFGLQAPLVVRQHPGHHPGSRHLLDLAASLATTGGTCYLREAGAPPDPLAVSASRDATLVAHHVALLDTAAPAYATYLGALGDVLGECLAAAAGLPAGKKKP